jgi:hypothetical protein
MENMIILIILLLPACLNASGFSLSSPSYEIAAYLNNQDFTLSECCRIDGRICDDEGRTLCRTKEYIIFTWECIYYFQFHEKMKPQELGWASSVVLSPKYYDMKNEHRIKIVKEDMGDFFSLFLMITDNLNWVTPSISRGELENLTVSGYSPGIKYGRHDLGFIYDGIIKICEVMRKKGTLEDIQAITKEYWTPGTEVRNKNWPTRPASPRPPDPNKDVYT